MHTETHPAYAALLLRLANGVFMLAHAGLKLFVFTPAGTAKFFESLGLPGPLAYLTIAAELLGGLALIAGLYTRWVALGLIPILIGAIVTAHFANGFFYNNAGGGWEFAAFWSLVLAAQALLGGGAHALTGEAPRQVARFAPAE